MQTLPITEAERNITTSGPACGLTTTTTPRSIPMPMPMRHTEETWEVEETEDGQWGLYALGAAESLAEFDAEADARRTCLDHNMAADNMAAHKESALLIEEMRGKLAKMNGMNGMNGPFGERVEEQLDALRNLIAKTEEVW